MVRFTTVTTLDGGQEAVNLEKIVRLIPIVEENGQEGTLIKLDGDEFIKVHGKYDEMAARINREIEVASVKLLRLSN
jgi:hypothetical protein